MPLIAGRSVRTRLIVLTVAIVTAIVGFGIISLGGLSHVKVNGPVYQRIVLGKDLVADILPPPEYLIETYLTAYQIVDAEPAKLIEYERKIAQLETDFETRHRYWQDALPDGPLKTAICEESYRPGRALLDRVKTDLVPAKRAGDMARARQVLAGEVTKLYAEHRAAVDRLVLISNAATASWEADARSAVARTVWALVIIVIGSAAGTAWFARHVSYSITEPLHEVTRGARRVAQGDLDVTFSYRGTDEVGALADSFRDVLGYVREGSDAALAISRGDLSRDVTPRSPQDVLLLNVKAMTESLRVLIEETGRLEAAAQKGDLRLRAESSRCEGAFARTLEGVNGTLDALILPLDVAATQVARLAAGEIPKPITAEWAGDFNTLKDNLNRCTAAVRALVDDVQGLAGAARRGDLAVRADASVHRGDFAAIVGGMNDTLDAVAGPIGVVKTCLDRIARGDIPEPVPVSFEGDFKAMCEDVNRCIDAVRRLVTDAKFLARAAHQGELSARADAGRHEGDFRAIVEGINSALDEMVRPVRAAADCVARIARGEVPPELANDYRGDFRALVENLNTCTTALRALLVDAQRIAAAASEGKLDVRADGLDHHGDFRHIIEAQNQVLDAVVIPVQITGSCLERIARGDIPEQVDFEFQGDLDALRRNLNTCTDAVRALIEDAGGLADAAVAGRLSARADASRHQGDFRRIVEGVNATLDAVVGPLETVASQLARVAAGEIPDPLDTPLAGDFEKIRHSVNTSNDAIRALFTDAITLSTAAASGDLSARADQAVHQGDFRFIVEGINSTLDAMQGPIGAAFVTLEKIADRDLTARMDGEYYGDHERIKTVLNHAAESLEESLASVSVAASQVAAASGQLTDASQSLASGASEQASAIEEVSASLAEINASTRDNARRANVAKDVASGAVSAARGGTERMQRLTQAIEAIHSTADQTAKIVKTIDEIAFQTNLLALNAAVEAARAGDAGKGFAVVAEEVRNLAMRSAEAAKNTADLIETSVTAAARGVDLNRDVEAALATIDQEASKVAATMEEIAAASHSQETAVAQVTTAVGEMSRMTQSAAATSEESASIAQELAAQASELSSLCSSFRLNVTARR